MLSVWGVSRLEEGNDPALSYARSTDGLPYYVTVCFLLQDPVV